MAAIFTFSKSSIESLAKVGVHVWTPIFRQRIKGTSRNSLLRDEAQGAQSTDDETYQVDRQGGEHRATQRFARKMDL